MANVLTAQHIAKSFFRNDGKMTVIEDISLALAEGEVLCVLGASGCGKTTLLSILAGLLQQDGGRIESRMQRPGPELGFMQQADKLLPWRTVTENVRLGLDFARIEASKALQKSFSILERIGLADFAASYPAQISGGMKQRVLLGRTLALDPKLLLLDEPLGHLDIIGRRDMADMIRQYIKNSGASAIVVTHSVEEAVFIADRILVLTNRPARVASEHKRGDNFEEVTTSLVKAIGI